MSRQSEPLTPPVPIDPLDVEDVLEKLTEKEKVDLLSGIDHWQTKAIPRLRIPSLRVSDGPNGVRGSRFFHGQPAACLPCGTALGATWDTDLLLRAGRLLGEESKAKGAHVLLAPTVNMQRGPLGGRGFESFSEDPVLSGTCAASIINGVQETEVVACIKHFVANDQEHERMAVDSLVTQRALREIYLLPFQIAIRDSRPRALMTAYNKVNGKHVSEDPFFLQHVLRREWAWQGLVMSDWYGTYSTSDAINAGLDLEMPGPSRWRGQQLTHALLSKKVLRHTLDARVREMLNLCNRASKTGVPEYALESTNDTPKTASLLRDLAASSIVLLKNEKRALPLQGSQSVSVVSQC
jgi:beta-glucosidase